jgi:hypothetical protein
MERPQPFRGSSDEPSSVVNIEFHQTFAAHFQKEGLAGFLIRNIGAFHDLIDFERLLAEHIQDTRVHRVSLTLLGRADEMIE